MAQQVFDKFLNWFSENVSVELSDDEKKELKEVLEKNEFDEEMLDFADEGDFKSITPQNWHPKKRFFLMKAFKHLKDGDETRRSRGAKKGSSVEGNVNSSAPGVPTDTVSERSSPKDIVPEVSRKPRGTQRMLDLLKNDKQSGEEKLEHARSMYLKTMSPTMLSAMVDARDTYQVWHKATYGQEATLPLTADYIKAFCVDLVKMNFTADTILQHYLNGLCTWHMANNITSPWQTYPGLANTVRGYLKKYAGFSSRFEREPLSPQDVEHLIGTCGIDTPQKQQISTDPESKGNWDDIVPEVSTKVVVKSENFGLFTVFSK